MLKLKYGQEYSMNNILLVTGASSDIGMTYLTKYGSRFSKIIAQYNTTKPDLKLNNVEYFQADLSSSEDITKLCNHLKDIQVSHFLHLSAAPLKYRRFHEITWDLLQKKLDIQVKSAFEICQVLVKNMKSNRYGKIVFILSTCTTGIPPKFMTDYVVEKYALTGLMYALSSEYTPYGLNINGLSPSMVTTKFLDNVPSIIVEKEKQYSPKERLLTPEDLSPAIDYLLSDSSDFVCGQNIIISGGR